MGSGTNKRGQYVRTGGFQSTHSVGSGTACRSLWLRSPLYFNPPTPWGVGRFCSGVAPQRIAYFNPPTPWGVGLQCTARAPLVNPISIHPLRGEWDASVSSAATPMCDFNPPTPWGVGLEQSWHYMGGKDFNPPTPWGVGHTPSAKRICEAAISIHPLRGEWDDLRKKTVADLCISIHPLRGEWDSR